MQFILMLELTRVFLLFKKFKAKLKDLNVIEIFKPNVKLVPA